MTTRVVTMNEHTCDGCGKVKYADPDQEQPLGFYISAAEVHSGGGNAENDIYACSEKCIRKAIVETLNGGNDHAR